MSTINVAIPNLMVIRTCILLRPWQICQSTDCTVTLILYSVFYAASLQQAHACGTCCRCIYDRTRTTHASSANWKHFRLWTSQPRRIVTIALMRHRSTLTYLLTYLLTYSDTHSISFLTCVYCHTNKYGCSCCCYSINCNTPVTSRNNEYC